MVISLFQSEMQEACGQFYENMDINPREDSISLSMRNVMKCSSNNQSVALHVIILAQKLTTNLGHFPGNVQPSF